MMSRVKHENLVKFAREETVTEMMTAETWTYRWMAPEEKKALKGEKLKQEEIYTWAVVDSVKERVCFSHDKDSMPRVWIGKEDTRAITKDARAEALNLLSVMDAIRLDERPDKIESTLLSSLMDGTISAASSHNRSVGTSMDPLA